MRAKCKARLSPAVRQRAAAIEVARIVAGRNLHTLAPFPVHKEVSMRAMSMILALSAVALSACTASVRTYDSSDHIIGSCKASRWILGPAVTCSGRANGEAQK